jgi:hypothetical protein
LEELRIFIVHMNTSGDVWIIGKTYSTDFPTTLNALYPTPTNVSYSPYVFDGFICRISGIDGSLEYSSYIGGDNVIPQSISISSAGYIWIAGKTDSDRIASTLNAVQTKYGGGPFDGFIMQLNSNAELLLFSSLYGGQGDDSITDTAMDKANLWITGTTSTVERAGFPISANAIDDTKGGTYDAFIGQIDNSDRKFPVFGYCSYLGGSDGESDSNILVDDQNKIWVIGETTSSDFPTKNAYDTNLGGSKDIFIFNMRLPGSLAFVDNSSYFGGSEYEYLGEASLDQENNIWITGSTGSEDFPIVDGYDELAPSMYGLEDAFVLRMDPLLKAVQYSTYLGGPGLDEGVGLGYDTLNDRIWVTGMAQNRFPLIDEYDNQLNGITDIFVSYFGPPMPPTPPRDLSGILSLDGKILLVWGIPEDSEDSPVSHYKVFRGLSEEELAYYAESTGLAFVDEDITTNLTYYYTVSAINGVGESEQSNIVSLAIPDIGNFTDLLESVPESTPATGLFFTISIIGILVIIRRRKNNFPEC